MSESGVLRVLVVEDEGAVALMIEMMLEDLGYEIAASVARLSQAQDAAATANFDIAVLDVNLGGQLVFPVADTLQKRNIPFIFSTGYGTRGLPPAYADKPVLAKPFAVTQLQRALETALLR